MLARTFLYLGDWVNAEIESNSVINNTNYYPDLGPKCDISKKQFRSYMAADA